MMLSILKSISFFQSHLNDFDKPLLVIQGSMNFLNQTEAMMRLFQRMLIKDKKLKIINNGYHELYMDLEKRNFMLAMIGWIDERTAKGCAGKGTVANDSIVWQFPKKPSSLKLKILCFVMFYFGVVILCFNQIEKKWTV